MKFIQRLETRKRLDNHVAYGQYRNLIFRAAKEGDLSDDDADRLEQIISDLGIALDQAKSDIAVVIESEKIYEQMTGAGIHGAALLDQRRTNLMRQHPRLFDLKAPKKRA